MLWLLLFMMLFLWIVRFGLGLGGIWLPLLMAASWIYFFTRLFVRHEHN